MGSGDFLEKGAETPLQAHYLAAGAACTLSTNFAPVHAAARASFRTLEDPRPSTDLHLRFWVDSQPHSRPFWAKPYYRGLDHLVFAGFDGCNSMLMDLRRRCAIGRFSLTRAEDSETWTALVFPAVLSVLGPVVGITNLHCACVVRDGLGLLLAGPAGAGKSTLALALAQCGLGLLSDDRTYISWHQGQLRAWGLPGPVKLLPDAHAFFPELSGLTPEVSLNGEPAFVVDAQRRFGVRRSLGCEPRGLVFLERHARPGFSLSELPAAQAAARLQQDLPEDVPEVMERHLENIRCLVRNPCWLLRYGGFPHAIAQALAQFFQSAFVPGVTEDRIHGDQRLG